MKKQLNLNYCVDFEKSLADVENIIDELKSFTIQKNISELEELILEIQSYDRPSYDKHADICLGHLSDGFSKGEYKNVGIAEKSKKIHTDYLSDLAKTFNFQNDFYKNIKTIKNSTAIKATKLYALLESELNTMTELHISGTHLLEDLSRNYKGTFEVDSKEAKNSYYLLSLQGNLTRMVREVDVLGKKLSKSLNNLEDQASQTYQFMDFLELRLNKFIDSLSFFDDLTKVLKIKTIIAMTMLAVVAVISVGGGYMAVTDTFAHSWIVLLGVLTNLFIATKLVSNISLCRSLVVIHMELEEQSQEIKSIMNDSIK